MAVELVAICKDVGALSGTTTCNDIVYESATVLPVSAETNLDLLLMGGLSVEAVELGFAGFLTLWAVGLAVGLIANQVRKLRS